MNNKKFYKLETFDLYAFTMLFVILILSIIAIYTPGLKLFAIAISIGLMCGAGYRFIAKYVFLQRKASILRNGTTFEGTIIDTRKDVTHRRNSNNTTYTFYRYYALIKFNNDIEDIEYWTPALNFDTNSLTSQTVTVHYLNGKIYVDDFQVTNFLTFLDLF